tara:strand:- start:54954 stop:55301 length:348 start_codon:yes stop_codon:yes gene_type:complete
MKNEEIFKGKTFQDLLADIYNNAKEKETQINILIKELKPLIKNIGDATIVVPLIKEYLDVGVKNDEHLIKMAAIVQRAMTRTDDGSSEVLLTEEEKKQLLDQMEKMEDDISFSES